MFRLRWNAARWRQWWRTGNFRATRAGSADRCIPVADTFEALRTLAARSTRSMGRENCRRHWLGRQNHNQRDPGGIVGHEITRAEIRRKFQQRIRLAADAIRAGRNASGGGAGDGHVAPGELKRLAAIARPDVGVVTRVSPAHLEFFVSVDEIALAKRELIEGLNGRESVAVLNADDPRVAAFAAHAPGKVLSYGIDCAG